MRPGRIASVLGFALALAVFAVPAAAFHSLPTITADSGALLNVTAEGSSGPEIIGASSNFVAFTFSVQHFDTNVEYDILGMRLTIYNELGFYPGGSGGGGNRGDLEQSSGPGSSFGIYVGPTLSTVTHVDSLTLTASALAESYVYDLSFPSGSRGSSPNIPSAASTVTGLTRRFAVILQTNDIIGDAPDSSSGGIDWIGPGDRFRLELDTVTFAYAGGNTVVATSVPPGGVYSSLYLLHSPVETGFTNIDLAVTPSFDASGSGHNDQEDLDLVPWRPVVALQLIGGPGNVQNLQEIVLNITHPAGMNLRDPATSPLAAIDNSQRSGIQIRGNSSPNGPDRNDVLYPIDLDYFQTSYVQGTTIDTAYLRLANFVGLSQEMNKSTTYFSNYEFCVAVSPSRNARPGDTLTFSVPRQGVRLNGVASRDSTVLRGSSTVMWGIPITFEDFTTEGQFVTQSSAPTAVYGIDIHDSGLGFRLADMGFYISNDNGSLINSDFLTGPEAVTGFSNTTSGGIASGGFALYRDNDSHPLNTNGRYDAGIDSFVNFRLLGVGTRFLSPTGNENLGLFSSPTPPNVLVAQMQFDTARAEAILPPNDNGANYGSDYFFVVRTSSSAAPGDKFRIYHGDLNVLDVLDQQLVRSEGVIRGSALNSASKLEGSDLRDGGPVRRHADWQTSDAFQSEALQVNGVVGAAFVNFVPVLKEVFPGDTVAVFGINVSDSGGTFRINQIKTVVVDSAAQSGDFQADTDLRGKIALNSLVANAATNGIALYQDNGDTTGSFDPKDALVGTTFVFHESGPVGVDTYTFIIGGGFDIPNNDSTDSQGSDLFIVITISDSITFRDDFVLLMPDSAITYSDPSLDQTPAQYSGVIRAGLPVFFNDVALTTTIDDVGTRKAVLGIDAADSTFTGDGVIFLDKVRFQLVDVTSFNILDLADLRTDSASGAAVWADSDANGIFSDTLDRFLPLTVLPSIFGADDFELDIVNDTVPNAPDNRRSDWFLVFRTRSGFVQANDQFRVRILTQPSGGVTFTATSDADNTITSNIITVQPQGATSSPLLRNIIAPDFAPGTTNGWDTTIVSFTVPNSADTSWTLNFINIADSTTHTIAGTGNATVVVGDTQPSTLTTTGVYAIRLDYKTASLAAATLNFGETLTVDLSSATLNTGPTQLPTTTTGNTVAIRAFSDTTGASAALETSARVLIFRNSVHVDTIFLSNYDTSYFVTLLSGANLIELVMIDAAGNRGNTVGYGTIQQVIGANVSFVQSMLSSATSIFPGDSFPVLGINLVRNSASPAMTMDSLAILFTHSGALDIPGDLSALGTGDTSGVLLYADNGATDGIFDASDQVVAIDPPITTSLSATQYRVVLRPSVGQSLASDDTTAGNVGFDYFVVINASATLAFGDSFTVSIPANGLSFSDPSLQAANNVDTTPLLTAGVNLAYTDSTSLASCLTLGSNATAIVGLNVSDITDAGGNGGAALSTFDVVLTPNPTFNLNDLKNLTTNPLTSGIALYRNEGSNKAGLDAGDSGVATTAITIPTGFAPYRVRLTFNTADTSSAVPSGDVSAADSGIDFWLVIRTASLGTASTKTFLPSIPSGGLVLTAGGTPSKSLTANTSVCIAAGSAGGSYSPSARWSPNGDGFRDTVLLAISLPTSDSRDFQVVFLTAAGETAHVRRGFGRDTTLLLNAAETSWFPMQFTTRILYTTDALTDSSFFDISGTLDVDTDAPAPSVTSPPATASGTSVDVTVVADLSAEAGGSANQTSAAAALLSAENNEGFVIRILVTGPNGETSVTTDTRAATTTDLDQAYTLTVFSGVNTVLVTLEDFLGNSDTTSFSITGGVGALVGGIGYEGNEPVFRFNPSNPGYTFTFRAPATGGGVEIFSMGGDRLRGVSATPGSPLLTWDAKNASGEVVRNGVYLVRFNVTLSDGSTVETVRTLLLLK